MAVTVQKEINSGDGLTEDWSAKGAAEDNVSKGYAFFDKELTELPPDLQWREWMSRIEAVLFASQKPVARDDLMRVIGQGVSLELLLDDLDHELKARPYELVQVTGHNGASWLLRTKPRFADAIKVAADIGERQTGFTETEMAVLCAIAYHQPIDRAGLADIFGKEISRDLLARLRIRKLIANGPRAPRPGAPHTFVTTPEFQVTFDLQSLRELPEMGGR